MKSLSLIIRVSCISFLVNLFLFASYGLANLNFQEDLNYIRYQITAIEHEQGNKAAKYQDLINKINNLIKESPALPDLYVWKAIALSAQAKKEGIAALPKVKIAKQLLEKAISIEPSVADGAAYNALAILYYKVPVWPISFGSDRQAEVNFKKALSVSSNIDTNYRYGEFLFEKGQLEKAKQYLTKAYNLPNRKGRKEDPLKKNEIKELIKRIGA